MSKMSKDKKSSKINIPSVYLLFYNTPFVKRLAGYFDKRLLTSRNTEDPKLFASRLFLILLVCIVLAVMFISFALIIFLRFYRATLLPAYLALSLVMLFLGVIIPPIAYLISILDISQKIDKIKNGVDAESFSFATLFVIFLKSGLSPVILFRKLEGTKAFSFVQDIVVYVNRRVQYLSESIEQALLKAMDINPGKLFNDFMLAYVTAIRTGAPVIETMEAKLKDLSKQFSLAAALASDKLQGVAESYVVWLSSGYIMLYLVLIMGAILPFVGNSSSLLTVLGPVVVLVVPMVNLLFVYMADSLQLKFPESQSSAYKIFYISLPIGLIIAFLIMIFEHQIIYFITLSGGLQNVFPVSIALLIGLLVALVPPAFFYQKEMREKSGFEEYAVKFLSAISEGLLAGLTFETVVTRLKDAQEMGKFREVLRKVDGYLKLGYPLTIALKRGADSINEFASKIALYTLSDMIEIGSMTPDNVRALADQINSQLVVRREYQGKVKPLIATPYAGVLISLIATFLLASGILSMLNSGIAVYGPIATGLVSIPQIIFITAISGILNAFLAGLLIGKIGYGKAAAGFIHAIILMIVVTLVIFVFVELRISIVPNFHSNISF
ncbi:type II secretion system protein [Sulfolobus acidocaldarius SUSAZ]|nr:type II secretion system protein [Sulfolobus acidocaldarius SUSAZ]